MAIQSISIDNFLSLAEKHPVLDVRSPKEFGHAHIPGSHSLPLFNDEERSLVGTAYKQQSRSTAIKLGLDFFGIKMRKMVDQAEAVVNKYDANIVLVHCWRGGMRSAAVAWLLDLYGFKVYVLKGGYKRFRNWVLAKIATPVNLRILSGYTGSGKTEILKEFAKMQQPVLDLEDIAGHKGSAFGDLGLPPQPSAEYFENKLALTLHAITQQFGNTPIWVESESSRIGDINVNHLFFNQMKTAPRVQIEIPLEARLNKVVAEYGIFKKENLVSAVLRIQRRLGGLETKKTLAFLVDNDFKNAFDILIRYYDKFYEKSTLFQEPFLNIHTNHTNALMNAEAILEGIKK